MNTEWIYDYDQPTTPELIEQVLNERPKFPWALPEEWDWWVFKLECLALRVSQLGEEKKKGVLEMLNNAIKMQRMCWQLWQDIKDDAEAKTGAKVLPVSEIVKGEGGLSRAYIDTIFVEAQKARLH